MADNFSYVSILNPGFATVPNTGPMAAGTFGYVSFVNPPSTVTGGGGAGATVNGSTGAVSVVGGPNVTVSNSAGSIYVVGQDIEVQDEGGTAQTVRVFNFAGAGVTVVVAGDTATITVPAGTPGGSDTEIQFNDGGTAFAGDAAFRWDKTNNRLRLGSTTLLGGMWLDSDVSEGIHLKRGVRIWWDDASENPLSSIQGSNYFGVDNITIGPNLRVPSGDVEASSFHGGTFSGASFTGPLIGNASTATTMQTTGSVAWDPSSLAPGAYTTSTVTVTGAALGHGVVVSLGVALPAGVMLTGAVTAVDTVTVTLWNFSGSTVDLGSSTLKARIVT